MSAAPDQPAPASGLADRLTATGLLAGWATLKALPASLTAPLFRFGADRAAARDGAGVRQLRANLRRVLGPTAGPAELDAAVRDGMRSYARYWLETFRLPVMDHDDVVRRVTAESTGLEYIDAALAQGRGAVLALPHSGNWDVAGLMGRRRWGSLTTVAERLKPERVYEKFLSYRESLGMEILPLTGGVSPSEVLKERLTAGGVVALLADRDLSRRGVPVTFFGEPTRMPAGPAMLAALTGAALFPVHLSYTADGWRQTIGPEITLPGTRLREQVHGGTQAVADVLAREIATAPADWHMLQPLWLADLPESRRAALGDQR
ncbi:phosphatidylinositol mannoside acyltransferase [Nakamurella flava]|uniref:phosphatidylinositol mannoside acyltransferase n=1 Tax=Nakamurella flava TaxID=2576308 RepID=UPI00197B33AE|nr:phosphatidylinositol mannoside acyltransferase [Nakamurella flava]